MAVKRDLQAKERQWKRFKKEVGRFSYCQACRNTNILINSSRNKDQLRKIEDCASDPKRKWAAIKDIFHPTTRQPTNSPDEDKSRATSCASFFRDKVINIRAAISSKLDSVLPDPISDDKPFSGQELYNLPPVTEGKVQQLLFSMSGKSSPRDFVPISLLKEFSEAFAPSSLSWQTSLFWKVLSLPASR